MAEPTKNHPRTLCVDLPTERDAMEVAKPIAEKLAERLQDRGGIVTVTDEHGNVVGTVSLPVKQKHWRSRRSGLTYEAATLARHG